MALDIVIDKISSIILSNDIISQRYDIFLPLDERREIEIY